MNTEKTDKANEDWLYHYNHFRARLQERYSIDISLKQYFIIHTVEVKKIKQLSDHKFIGSVNYLGREIFIVKKNKASVVILSAFPPQSRHLKKWIADKQVRDNAEQENQAVTL